MKIKSERDFWSGILFLVVGIAFAVGATNYSMGVAARPGPGYFPLILSCLMAILGAVVLFKSLTIETEDGDKIGPIAWRPLIVVVAAISMFALALPRFGLIITVPILIIIVSLAGREFRWKGVLIASVVLTVGSWGIFIAGLNLTIPLWPIYLAAH
ncbi:MAG: tripartite tricarboxylate transporter TctB family protein [Rhizobacter sp.]